MEKLEPGHGRAGRHPTKEFLDTLELNRDPGMFGRMFLKLDPLKIDDQPLRELAAAMQDPDPANSDGNNETIPAGFTYLGQFIDHDITLDLTSINEKIEDPNATKNFRSPALDLDAVYGLGPDGSRHLYARNAPDFSGKTPGPKFLIANTIPGGPGNRTDSLPNGFPRSPEGFALIGDHRNDENLMVAQTHLAFSTFGEKAETGNRSCLRRFPARSRWQIF